MATFASSRNVLNTSDNTAAEEIENSRVVINVSGFRFETQPKTLNHFKDTLLGDPRKRNRYYNPTRKEYFFDRDIASFGAILSYYQSRGRLWRPITVPPDVFAEEIRFYELGQDVIDRYVWEEGLLIQKERLPSKACQKKIWLLFEYPRSSALGVLFAIFSASMIIFYVVSFCVETLPKYAWEYEQMQKFYTTPFFISKSICISWFTLELLVRFATCPTKVRFFKKIVNIIDFFATVPPFIALYILVAFGDIPVCEETMSLAILKVVTLVRVIDLFPFFCGRRMQILKDTMKASAQELVVLLCFFFIAVLLFSSAIYVIEAPFETSHFISVPDAFWWAAITLTTVGYGDVTPISEWGKVVASLCALVGIVLTIVLPAAVLFSNYNYFYRREMEQKFNAKHVSASGASNVPPDSVGVAASTNDRHNVMESEEGTNLLTR